MTEVGDRWREFALFAARICKNRSTDGDNFSRLSDILHDCGDREYALYKDLQEAVR